MVFLLSGCVVRTYPLVRDRVDQDLSAGNRGYLAGEAPAASEDRPTTRTTQVVEVELRSPLKFERAPRSKPVQAAEGSEAPAQESFDEELTGNRGYMSESVSPEAAQPAGAFEQYTVQKGDTLQKISKKFFGTTKKWPKIFAANKETLSSPNKLRPGQVINIPTEGLKETKENLK